MVWETERETRREKRKEESEETYSGRQLVGELKPRKVHRQNLEEKEREKE